MAGSADDRVKELTGRMLGIKVNFSDQSLELA
jgi:hypothetical protein